MAKKKKYSIVLKPGKESLLGRFHSSSSGIKGVGGWVGTVVTRLDYRPLQAGLGGAGGLSTWLSCECVRGCTATLLSTMYVGKEARSPICDAPRQADGMTTVEHLSHILNILLITPHVCACLSSDN